MKVTRSAICNAVFGLMEINARKATVYLDKQTVVSATMTQNPKQRKKYNCTVLLLKLGRPNGRERAFMKACQKAQEPFPVKRTIFKFWPKKK